jgi:hypothetical protein
MISQASQRAVSGLEQTSRDDNKTIVSDILKRVDQLIKKGDLERAQAEIVHAKEVDSRNVYTRRQKPFQPKINRKPMRRIINWRPRRKKFQCIKQH